jgi:hypothetical protein
MFRHVLLLQVRPEASTQDIASCRDALAGLVSVIPGLLNYHWGENLAPTERRDGYTHGFSMDFADAASLAAYGPHPAHQRAAQLVRTHFSRVAVFDFPFTANA